jgi:uncharacterized protein YggU (UPF0235/DUF167 family)
MGKYTPEHITFLKENIKGRTNKELTELFNAQFGLDLRATQINGLRCSYGIKSDHQCYRYSKEQIDFIKDNVKGRTNKELTEMFNHHFGLNLKISQIQDAKSRYGLKSNTIHKYTKEQVEFLAKNVKGRTLAELTKMFNKKFNVNLKDEQISNAKNRYGLYSDLPGGQLKKGHTPWNKGMKGLQMGGKETQFKKGNIPTNYRPVGSERITKNDIIEIKIADPNEWRSKHVHIWEKANGPVPKSHVVIFGDGNRRNFDLNNLILVSRVQLARLNQNHLIADNADLTRSGIIIADIISKINERKKIKKG